MKIISDFKQLVLVDRFDFLIFLESFADVDIVYDVAIQRIMGNLPLTNATLALKHPGISNWKRIKTYLSVILNTRFEHLSTCLSNLSVKVSSFQWN